ncbi:unnamed protein product [Colias eurytheme]|nr:unnamed protein product [Colias eurytheme]
MEIREIRRKANIVNIALELCFEYRTTMKALTFYGCPANLAMAKHLGCKLQKGRLKTHFKHPVTGANVYFFLDPVYMLKLLRNTFEQYREFEDENGNSIRWDYVQLLQELQDKENFHLANKLRAEHIYLKKIYEEKTDNIKKDIKNWPHHIFGDLNTLFVPELVAFGVFQKLTDLAYKLSQHAYSFAYNETNNSVESFKATFAKRPPVTTTAHAVGNLHFVRAGPRGSRRRSHPAPFPGRAARGRALDTS